MRVTSMLCPAVEGEQERSKRREDEEQSVPQETTLRVDLAKSALVLVGPGSFSVFVVLILLLFSSGAESR